jgi:hypothetical protein
MGTPNNMAHFPKRRMEMWTDTMKYAEEIQILQQESSSWFQDFQEHEATSRFVSQHHLMLMMKRSLTADLVITADKSELHTIQLRDG